MIIIDTIEMKFHYDYPVFAEEDAQKIQDYCVGSITLTDEELEKYDVNMDGTVDVVDSLIIKKMITGTDATYSNGVLVVNTTNPKHMVYVKITDGYKSGNEYCMGIGGVINTT